MIVDCMVSISVASDLAGPYTSGRRYVMIRLPMKHIMTRLPMKHIMTRIPMKQA